MNLQLLKHWHSVITVILLGLPLISFAQPGMVSEEPIVLSNSDLEDRPRSGRNYGIPIQGWYDCNKPGQTFVDVQPGQFKVETLPQSGQSYVGMVVRQDETWEGISQGLRRPLRKGNCYTFSGHLAKSPYYISLSQATGKEENFANPVKLRIWGGNQFCTKKELLDESPLIHHENWKEYQFRFEPTFNHTHIYLEVFYKTPSLFPYNGNILIDNFGKIFPIPCDEEEVIEVQKNPPIVNITNPIVNGVETKKKEFVFRADVGNITKASQLIFVVRGQKETVEFNPALGIVSANLNLENGPNLIKLVATNPDGTSQESRTVIYHAPIYTADAPPKPAFDPEVLTGLKDRRNLIEGSTIAIDKLFFLADSARIEKENFPVLDELFRFLMVNQDISIELGGYTNNRCEQRFCLTLSARRSKAVLDHLVEKGIPAYRLKSKGYGKLNPVADNKTPEGRKQNQRVEIKILKMEAQQH